jgi:hypothetical protein
MTDLTTRRAALIAACQAGQAVASILLTLTESDEPNDILLDPEAESVEKLAEAVVLAIELTPQSHVSDEMNQLHGACLKFIQGWAG